MDGGSAVLPKVSSSYLVRSKTACGGERGCGPHVRGSGVDGEGGRVKGVNRWPEPHQPPSCLLIFLVVFKEEPLPDSSLRGFPSTSGPPFGPDVDFSPPRPPYPSYPHEDPAYETPYLSEGFGYSTPALYPQTGPPPSYRSGLRMFPETGGTTGCARLPSVSFLPRPFPGDQYGGQGSSFALGLPFSPPAPFRPPLPSSPPLEDPFHPQSAIHPLPPEGYNEVGPGYTPGEGASEQEKARGGYSSGFRDSVPIQGITLEEGGCGTGGCECK